MRFLAYLFLLKQIQEEKSQTFFLWIKNNILKNINCFGLNGTNDIDIKIIGDVIPNKTILDVKINSIEDNCFVGTIK